MYQVSSFEFRVPSFRLQVATAPFCGNIPLMPNPDEITTADAIKLAEELGKTITQKAITNAARRGRILGARKLWNSSNAMYVFRREAFLEWLESDRKAGRPKSS